MHITPDKTCSSMLTINVNQDVEEMACRREAGERRQATRGKTVSPWQTVHKAHGSSTVDWTVSKPSLLPRRPDLRRLCPIYREALSLQWELSVFVRTACDVALSKLIWHYSNNTLQNSALVIELRDAVMGGAKGLNFLPLE